MLEKIFQNLNLSKEETDLYLELLKTGITPAGKLAKKLELPRSTVYGFLSNLKKQGLVIETFNNKLKLFEAENPENIVLLLAKQKEKLDKDVNLYKDILPQLKKNSFNLTRPRFKFYEGLKGAKFVINDILNYQDTEIKSTWPIQDMLKIITPEFLHQFNIQRIQKGILLKLIWPRNRKVDIEKYPFLGIGGDFRREVRIAPEKMDYSTGYWLYANKVAFLSSVQEAFGFIIESGELKHSLESQFEIIWKISKPLPTSNCLATRRWLENIE